MIPIIGGKLDGQNAVGKMVLLEEKGEQYILMTYRDSDKKPHFFYMLTGSVPEEATKIYRERMWSSRKRNVFDGQLPILR